MYSVIQKRYSLQTSGRGFYAITERTREWIAETGIQTGTCHLFLQHTSASLVLCENAAPEVRHDLELLIQRIAPDGDPQYQHNDEGPDDMAAHFRTILSGHELTIPVTNGKPALGTWQGVYLWEHRAWPHTRNILMTVQGLFDER